MTKAKLDTLEFLLQLDITGARLPTIGKEQWQILYLSAHDTPHRLGIWCALLDNDLAARAMEVDTWDLRVGHGKPGFSQSWSNGKKLPRIIASTVVTVLGL
jgi:hypothetical protein